MAQDDYFVIVYKLLKYLYDCLKSSARPKDEALTPEFYGIEDTYWEYIIRNLYQEEYVSGVTLSRMYGKPDYPVIQPRFTITPKGIQYLSENTMFKKIQKHVRDVISIIGVIK